MIKKVAVSILLAIVLIACGNSGPKEVTETRTVQPPPKAAESPVDATTALPPGHPPMPPAFKWETPAAWEEAPLTPMRIANFKVKSNPKVECYMTILQGAAGGLNANINRWREQMGQSELSAEAISKLPEIQVLGHPSKLAEIPGSFTGMSGAPQSGYMLLGLIAELQGRSLFVKMTGPEDAVKAEKERFVAFCKSLKETAPANPEAAMQGMKGTCPAAAPKQALGESTTPQGTCPAAMPKQAPAKSTAPAGEGK